MPESRPSVTIVGAGIAGMSAALRLLQAGRAVRIIEKTARVGGQFGAIYADGRYHEHAFHIFAKWCQNFFAICKDIGVRVPADPEDNDSDFDPRPAFLTLRPLPVKAHGPDGRDASRFGRLEYVGSPQYFWRNANAGVAHWSDMMIYQYSILDLLSDDSLDNEDTKEFLNRVSVNGFMHSRPYASDMAAVLHHELLLKVFAVPSYRTSARAYQTYLRHTAAFLYPWPSFWALRGNVYEHFWKPFEEQLEKTARTKDVSYDIQPGKEVTGVKIVAEGNSSRVTHIEIDGREEAVEQLLLAVPPRALEKILRNSPRLAEVAPELMDVAYLEAVPVPALNLYFNKRIELPEEHITLLDPPDDFYHPDSSLARKNGIASEYGLSLVDHSRLWPELEHEDKTVISVLAGDARLLAEEDEDTTTSRLVATLRKYIRFDPREDIEDSHLQTHREEPLFVNTEGSWEYRPEARLDDPPRKFPRVQEKVSNLFLAGDYCRSEVDIVSVEGAIVTGISAAHLICDRVPPPIRPAEFDRHQVRRAKATLDGWIDLATRRSDQNFLSERRRVTEERRQRVVEQSRPP
jgi:uncharacterized protein with NAD-binding domain and iron-sulfur cluster